MKKLHILTVTALLTYLHERFYFSQLVVRDSLKKTRILSRALSEYSSICGLLHTRSIFREEFEEKFDWKGIPTINATRWNSTLTHVISIIMLSRDSLIELLSLPNIMKDNLKLIATERPEREWLVDVLNPFLEAISKTQEEKVESSVA